MADLTANPDSATTLAATAVNVSVLANDTLDGSPVALGDLTGPPTIVTPPAQGTAVVQPDGTVTYTPPAGFCGQVTFEYQIEAPDAPAGACLCVMDRETKYLLSGVPGGFNTGLPLLATAAGGCMQFVYAGTSWETDWMAVDCDNDLNLEQGLVVTLTQGEVTASATVCSMEGAVIEAVRFGADAPTWAAISPAAPGATVSVSLGGGAYEGLIDIDGTTIIWTVAPPISWPAPGFTSVIPLDSMTIDGTDYCGVIAALQGS